MEVSNNGNCQIIILFVLAGLFEIGGGYLVWLWLRVLSIFWSWKVDNIVPEKFDLGGVIALLGVLYWAKATRIKNLTPRK